MLPRTMVALATSIVVLAAATESQAGAVNGRVAFTSFRDGALGDIWTVDPDGSDLRKLTADPPEGPPRYDAQSDWSPDGRQLAFRRGPNASTRLGVWRMTRDGQDQHLLAEGDPLAPRQNATQPSWAPDGGSILFRANRPPYADTDVWEMDPEGGGQRLLTHLEGEQLYPSYAPDKRRIAYTSSPGGDRGIFTAAPDGGDIRVVFDAPGVDDSAPNWSPDGTLLAFESAIDGDGEIYVIGADGTGLQQLTSNDVHDEGPSWSPDGRRIVFTSGPDNLNGDLFVMDADGSERMQITDSPGRDESPDWQPVPHAGDATTCGDFDHTGPGPYSVMAGGARADCTRALRLAGRWAGHVERGHPARHVGDFACRAEDAGDGAQLIACRHRSSRRTAVWLWRGAPA